MNNTDEEHTIPWTAGLSTTNPQKRE